MTDFSDSERQAAWQRAQDILARTAGVRDDLRARQERARAGEGGPVAPDPPDPASAPVRARERPVDNWQGRVSAIVTEKFHGEVADAIGQVIAQERRDMREEVKRLLAEETGAFTALLGEQEKLIAALVARIGAMEARLDLAETRAAPIVPRLVHHDAA